MRVGGCTHEVQKARELNQHLLSQVQNRTKVEGSAVHVVEQCR